MKIHNCRHTFTTETPVDGVDVQTVQKWLGHKDIQTTMRYIKILSEHMQDQAQHGYPISIWFTGTIHKMCIHVCTLCARSEIQTDQQTLRTPNH